jgi:hypothetical protein
MMDQPRVNVFCESHVRKEEKKGERVCEKTHVRTSVSKPPNIKVVFSWECAHGVALRSQSSFLSFAALFAQGVMYYTTWGVESERHLWVHMHDL